MIVKLRCTRHGVSDVPLTGTDEAFVQKHFTSLEHKPGDKMFTYERISMFLSENPILLKFKVTDEGVLVNESMLNSTIEFFNRLAIRK